MPLIIESHDSLPYIDRPPTPTATARAHALIASSLGPDASTTPHPLLPDLAETKFSPLIESELERIASKIPLKAIDLSRYEASPTIDVTTDQKQARQALQAAYTNSSYLGLRLQALELLEQFGKNAWLVGNSQLEDVLRSLEKELVETRQRTEDVNRERKAAQEGGRAAMEGSERAWREGVGRVVEVQLGISEAEQRWREGLRSQRT